MLSSVNNNRVKIDSDYLKDECLKELYEKFESWDLKDLKDAQNALNLDVGWWNRVLYWADLEPTEYYDNKGKKYHFKSRKYDVYCSFTPWLYDDGEGGGGPALNFYQKIGYGNKKEDYQHIGKIHKFCVEGKIRGLIDDNKAKQTV